MLNNEAFEEIQSFHETPAPPAPAAKAPVRTRGKAKNEIEAITICDRVLADLTWPQKQLVLDFLVGKHMSHRQEPLHVP